MSLTRKRPLEQIKDDEVREQLKEIQEEALGNALTLSSAPTAGTPLLEDNEVGQNGNDLWFRIGSNLYKITADEIIAIT